MGVINGSKHKLVYDGMWHFDIPKTRDIDAGKVEVIARNSCGEAYASTTLTVNPRQDDYRAVLKHNVKPFFEETKSKNTIEENKSENKQKISTTSTASHQSNTSEMS